MRWPNSSSFCSHTRTAPSPLCRKSPKVTSVSSPKHKHRWTPCTHTFWNMTKTTPSLKSLSPADVTLRCLPGLFALMCWYPGPTLAAGLFLSHQGVAHFGSQPGLGVGRLNLLRDKIFHSTAALCTGSQREKTLTVYKLAKSYQCPQPLWLFGLRFSSASHDIRAPPFDTDSSDVFM